MERGKDQTGRSDVQQEAEKEIRRLLCGRFPGLDKCTLRLRDGSQVEVDAGDQAHSIFIEIFARQGPLKDGQKKKIARDILKLLLLKYDLEENALRIGLAYANAAIHTFDR